MREVVGYARELLGANSILLDHQVARFFRCQGALLV
jgi:hypothetical protein